MKNSKKTIFNKDLNANNKLVYLLLWYQIEDSSHCIRLIEQDIRFIELKKRYLILHEPWKISKKKHVEWVNHINYLNEEISQKYNDIVKKILIVQEMQNQILNLKYIELDKISFYDLLTLLKFHKQPKEVSITMADKTAIYCFDIENGYTLKNRKDEDINFMFYLGDALTDNQKLEKLIKVEKK